MTLFQIGFLLLFCAVGTFAGSICPPRYEIYPCSCINVHLSRRRAQTIVVCHGLKNTADLNNIVPALSRMDVDKLNIYDSFWAAEDNERVFPNDFLTLTNIREVEIMDSVLSACFACQWSTVCRNSITTGISLVNSTSSEKICTLCDTGRGSRLPWMPCLSKLELFQLSHGNLKSVTPDFFPLTMSEMKVLNFSHNQISKIDTNAFKNLPKLKKLDLSHNAIDHVDHTFGQRTELEFLDVSHNLIKMVGTDLIPMLPKIKYLNFAYNRITEIKQTEWRRFPDKLNFVDFTGNSINCDCNMKWLNSTLPTHIAFMGTCSGIVADEFKAYKNSRLRAASKHMNEKCDVTGRLRISSSTTQRPRSSSRSRS